MTASVFTCSPDDDVESLMAVMTERRFRHVPVVRDGRAVRDRQHRRRGEEPASTSSRRTARSCVEYINAR